MLMTPSQARDALTGHRLYHYRGCGPDQDDPRMAAGDPDLPVDAWGPYTGDGAEPQAARYARERAAKSVCGYCPVRTECASYANTETEDGKHLVEPEGIWGGQVALDRHRALIARRTAAADTVTDRALAEARSPQKLAVLTALAVDLYDQRVARRAGMDVRTANWHRSALCSLLGLDKETATRDDLLAAAVHHGLLPAGIRIVWDGLWPIAAAPTTDGIRQRRIAPGIPAVLFTPRARPARRRRAAAAGTAGTPAAGRAAATGAAAGGRARMRLIPTPPDTLPTPNPAAHLEPAA